MNQTDPFSKYKAAQREGWGLFAPLEVLTTPPAGHLVDFADVKSKLNVLDVACGTGVVAVTAARRGANVNALDLSPVLLERAQANAKIAGVEIDFVEGDAEALPYEDNRFDFVLSQFGHMFAPRPEIAISEMLRVLKPGGTIAFSTWPPEHFTGQMFTLVSKYLPLPEGVAPPPEWGNPETISKRLGTMVTNLKHDRQVMRTPSLSPAHTRLAFESTAAPLIKIVSTLSQEDPAKLEQFRKEFEILIGENLRRNILWQHFLMTKAFKK